LISAESCPSIQIGKSVCPESKCVQRTSDIFEKLQCGSFDRTGGETVSILIIVYRYYGAL
jgi:hypothetical protein